MLHLQNIDISQTQFEFEDDKHLYLADVPWFMNKSIIIAGMVHNVEGRIEPILESLNEIYCIFNNTIFFIFESNSKDQTPHILKQWSLDASINPFCDRYKMNKHRKKNSRWRHNMLQHTIMDKIKQHKPSLVRKQVVFNDTIVINDMYKLQKSLHKNMSLNRIERYVIYRNMMLQQIQTIQSKYAQAPWIITFDYFMLMDMDLFDFNKRMLFNELYHSPTNVMCANGVVHIFDMMYDIFASVLSDGTWMHSIAFDSKQWKQKTHSRILTHFPLNRYESMRSCFGGITIYKSVTKLLSTECNYKLILPSSQKGNSWNKYIAQNPDKELQQMADKYQMWMHSDEKICEHLPFHYCLRKHGFTISIAKNAKAYYSNKQIAIPMYHSVAKMRDLNKLPTLRDKERHN